MSNSTCRYDLESAKKELVKEFSAHRETLWNTVYLRMDHRLGGRVDPDDVIQEAYLDASNRLPQFVAQHESWSMSVWIRVILKQTLINVHRRHFAAKKRDASRELRTGQENNEATSTIAERIVGRVATPTQLAIRREAVVDLNEAIDRLKPNDQTILRLRHMEELTNKEIASRLFLSEKASSIRYVRAFERLKKEMHK